MAKFKLGNEMRGEKYWEVDRRRGCRICDWREETWSTFGKYTRDGFKKKDSKN